MLLYVRKTYHGVGSGNAAIQALVQAVNAAQQAACEPGIGKAAARHATNTVTQAPSHAAYAPGPHSTSWTCKVDNSKISVKNVAKNDEMIVLLAISRSGLYFLTFKHKMNQHITFFCKEKFTLMFFK